MHCQSEYICERLTDILALDISNPKVQITSPDRKGGDKNKDHIRSFPLLTQVSCLQFRVSDFELSEIF